MNATIACKEMEVSDRSHVRDIASRLTPILTSVSVAAMDGPVWLKCGVMSAGCCSISNFRYRGNLQCFFTRSYGEIRRDDSQIYILAMPLVGSTLIAQNGKCESVTSDRFGILSTSSPCRMQANHDDSFEHACISVCFSSDSIRTFLPNVDDIAGMSFDLKIGGAIVARDIFVSLGMHGDRLSASEAESTAMFALKIIIESIRTSLVGPDTDAVAHSHHQSELPRLILSYIRQHRSDPDLSIVKVATGCGISASYVSHLLRLMGTSFRRSVWDQRLESAYDRLRDHRAKRESISQIAYQEGFKSNAHFTRAFKKRYGQPPSEVRLESLSMLEPASEGIR